MKKLIILLLLVPIIMMAQGYKSGYVSPNYAVPTIANSSNYLVEANNGSFYNVYVDSRNNDVYYNKSIDRGKTWETPVLIKAASCYSTAIWYDRWTDSTGTLGDLIHVAYIDNSSDNCFYRTINTASSDDLGIERTAWDSSGVTVSSYCFITMTVARGGNIMIGGTVDNFTDRFCRLSADGGSSWSSIGRFAEAAYDSYWLMPGFVADNQDMICIYHDMSAGEVSKKIWDNSALTWTETSILTGITVAGYNSSFGYSNLVGVCPDLYNQQLLVSIWDDAAIVNGDLRFFKIKEASNAESTNVILNAPATTTLSYGPISSIAISNGIWYCFYTFGYTGSSVKEGFVAYKSSSDYGSTWSSETIIMNEAKQLTCFFASLRFTGLPIVLTSGFTNSILTPITIKKVNGVTAW